MEYKGESWRARDARERGLLPEGEAVREICRRASVEEEEALYFFVPLEWHHQGFSFQKVNFGKIDEGLLKEYLESDLAFSGFLKKKEEERKREEEKRHADYVEYSAYVDAVIVGDVPPTAKFLAIAPTGHRQKTSFQKKEKSFWFGEGKKAFATLKNGEVICYGGMTAEDLVSYDENRRREGNSTAFTYGSSFEILPL